MKYNPFILLAVCLLMVSCTLQRKNTENTNYEVKRDTLTLLDPVRNRRIPVAFYYPETRKKIANQQVIIFNHGYGFNKGGDYFVYSE